MTIAEKIYEMLSTMPEEQVIQVLNFVTELHDNESDIKQKLDFRKAAGLGKEIWKSVDVEGYIQQERSSWD
jgi:thioredoxin-related protein